MLEMYLEFSSYLTYREIRLAEDSDEKYSNTCWGVSNESLLQLCSCMEK